MSLLSTVEQAIKLRKAEQAQTTGRIQLYREILRTLTPQPEICFEESDSADDAATGYSDTETSPGEKEDIELLERALEKALQVRTGTGPSKKHASGKKPGTTVATPTEGLQTSAASKGNQTTISASTSTSLDRKEHKKLCASVSSKLGSKSSARKNPGQCRTRINRNKIQNCPVSSVGISHQRLARKSHQAVSVSGPLDPLKNKSSRGNVLSGDNLGKAAAHSLPSSNNTAPFSHPAESVAHSLPRQKEIVFDQVANWKSLRRKQNRLWDKVAALQRKAVPGRSQFVERMRVTFPKDWPVGSPDQTRALVDRLTHQGLDITQQCHTKELLAKQTPEAAVELGKSKKSGKTLGRLQMAAAELQNFASQVKQEWEAWDQWRPEGGCLCPTGANGVLGDGMGVTLPPTITYTTEAELRELEKLRMRVAMLQQEIYLEQTLSEALAPQISSVMPEPGCPNVSRLRDVYSLLGEGGQQFPAVVLDSEPD